MTCPRHAHRRCCFTSSRRPRTAACARCSGGTSSLSSQLSDSHELRITSLLGRHFLAHVEEGSPQLAWRLRATRSCLKRELPETLEHLGEV